MNGALAVIPAGYLRSDEAFGSASEIIREHGRVDGLVLGLVGFDLDRFGVELGKGEQGSKSIHQVPRGDIDGAMAEMCETMRGIAVSVLLDRERRAGRLTFWYEDAGRLYRVLPHVPSEGCAVYYGQMITDEARNSDYEAWRTGRGAAIVGGVARYDVPMLIDKEQFATVIDRLRKSYPPARNAFMNSDAFRRTLLSSPQFAAYQQAVEDALRQAPHCDLVSALLLVGFKDMRAAARVRAILTRSGVFDMLVDDPAGYLTEFFNGCDASFEEFPVVDSQPARTLRRQLERGEVRARYRGGWIDAHEWPLRRFCGEVIGDRYKDPPEEVYIGSVDGFGVLSFPLAELRGDVVAASTPQHGAPSTDFDRAKPTDLTDVADNLLLASHWPEIPPLHSWRYANGDISKIRICNALASRRHLFDVSCEDLSSELGADKIPCSASNVRKYRDALLPELADLVRAQNPQKQQFQQNRQG
ncbi:MULTISPECIES: hypothetical protein [Asticcacaulis]|uniref:hypothetical protein n=1 Tax=Asticcacaulis TaxID=76890 RepID=UPI001AE28960|nr:MULTISPECIES: hypothetical protein [Asticcacaulis]MBP2159541.1 hypothetical protein [Asticcacaulis solisilvae]MDR6800632.1 hypothetical protein [Asticcacaulis sp. BE141]